MSSIDEYLKKYNKQTAANTQAKVDAVNNAAAVNSQIVKDNYGAQIKDTEQSYNDMFDQNNVQRIINERKIAENMANMGLTDSGLNRTQMTANQLSYANNQNKLSMERQKAVDDLARVMNAQLATIESERASKEASIRTADYDANYANAVESYNNDQKAYADLIEQQNKAVSAMQDDLNDLMLQLGKNYNSTFKGQLVQQFANKYGLTYDQAAEMVGDYTKFGTVSDDSVTSAVDNEFTYDDVTPILSNYHKSNESETTLKQDIYDIAKQKGWLVSYTNANGQKVEGLNDIGRRFESAVLDRTEGTRKFWTNPHIDGPLNYVAEGTLGKKSDDGISYSSTIKDQYGNIWTLRDVYNASIKALTKEGKLKSKSEIEKEAKVQVKKIQKAVFG